MFTKRMMLGVTLLACTASTLVFADATDDLFAAIERGNVAAVEDAIARDAKITVPRTTDGHTALSLAAEYAEQDLPLSKRSVLIGTGLLAAIGGGVILPWAALKGNTTHAILSLAGVLGASFVERNTVARKIVATILEYAGYAGLVKSAWESNSTILAMLGTLGLFAAKGLPVLCNKLGSRLAIQAVLSQSLLTKSVEQLKAQAA